MPQQAATHSSRAGRWEKHAGYEPFACFLPAPLPPDPPTQYDAELQDLEKLGFVKEFTGKQRNRLFSYAPYLKILHEGMEPPKP